MTNIRQSRLGVLCYRLSPPTVSIIEKMAQAVPEFPLKAYPIYGPRPAQVVNFPFRPSEKTPKTFFFNNIRGSAPENQIRALGLNLAVELVRQSDVICLIGLQGIPALIAVVLGRMKHKPVLVLSQTMNSLAEVNRPAILRILKGIMLRLSTYHVAQTPITLDTLVRNYRIPTEKITLIPWDGGAGAFYDSIIKSGSCSRAETRRELGITESTIVILFCGTLIYLKGVDILIKAVAKLNEIVPDILLMAVGPDGDKKGALTDLRRLTKTLKITPKVRFLGELPWEQLAEIYFSSDIFVLPTRKDTWGKVLVEAGLAGLPLITTDICGAAGYLVQDNKNGFIIPVDDVDALFGSLTKLMDLDTRLAFGRASIQIMSGYLKSDEVSVLFKKAIMSCFG